MTDRALPYACAVANRVVDTLAQHGDIDLAGEVAIVNRATCDLVHALHREQEATTHAEQSRARHDRLNAQVRLHTGVHPADVDETQAAWDYLQALLRARPSSTTPRRHAGFITPSEPA